MPTSRRTTVAAAVIGKVVEQVFATVADVRRNTLAQHAAATSAGGTFADDDLHALAPGFTDLLRRPGELAAGLGVILEPGTVPGHPLRLEWWQWVTGREDPAALEVDLHPDSVGFYDYVAAEWFAVPRRTRRRHVVGPYVDVHGTDRYMLTFTMPMEVDGRFLGVAGADVPVTRFESVVLSRLGDDDAVVANDEGRVVVSTTSRWTPGCLLPAQGRPSTVPLPRSPWELVISPG
jgi:hypothetical protein